MPPLTRIIITLIAVIVAIVLESVLFFIIDVHIGGFRDGAASRDKSLQYT